MSCSAVAGRPFCYLPALPHPDSLAGACVYLPPKSTSTDQHPARDRAAAPLPASSVHPDEEHRPGHPDVEPWRRSYLEDAEDMG